MERIIIGVILCAMGALSFSITVPVDPLSAYILLLLFLIPGILLFVKGIKAEFSKSQGKEARIPCPSCAEMIMKGAKICRFCNKEILTDSSDIKKL